MLLEQDRSIFSAYDLAVLWEVENKNTLLTAVIRYENKGHPKRIYKGLYSTKSLDKLISSSLDARLLEDRHL